MIIHQPLLFYRCVLFNFLPSTFSAVSFFNTYYLNVGAPDWARNTLLFFLLFHNFLSSPIPSRGHFSDLIFQNPYGNFLSILLRTLCITSVRVRAGGEGQDGGYKYCLHARFRESEGHRFIHSFRTNLRGPGPGSTTVFYLTWGRLAGWSTSCWREGRSGWERSSSLCSASKEAWSSQAGFLSSVLYRLSTTPPVLTLSFGPWYFQIMTL